MTDMSFVVFCCLIVSGIISVFITIVNRMMHRPTLNTPKLLVNLKRMSMT